MKTPKTKYHWFCLTSSVALVQLMLTVSSHAASFTVTTTDDSGVGSLRWAIIDANASVGVMDTIAFNISGTGPHTIQPLSALPVITDPVIIDGYTQPGSSPNTLAKGDDAVLLIELNGSLAGDATSGLTITAGASTVRGLVINRFAAYGLHVNTAGANVIAGNFIGTDVDGSEPLGNGESGIVVNYAVDCLIGGTMPEARNVVSCNSGYGLYIGGDLITSRNVVQGNFIGTDRTGTRGLFGQSCGLSLASSANLVGGVVSGARNVISGNGIGVRLANSGNKVQGNFIGTDPSGTVALGNECGIYSADSASDSLIGGLEPGAGNLISGNSLPTGGYYGGVHLNSVTGMRIQGNLFGADATGTLPLPNSTAVTIDNSSDNAIGGSEPASANRIAHSLYYGILVTGDAAVRNAIRGNSIFDNGLSDPARPLGIDLMGSQGVTLNDPLDEDTGPNNLQNFPTITSASASPGGIQIQGNLNSTPGTIFILDFYANQAPNPSGYFEGETYLGAASMTTDGGGNGSFNVTLPTMVPAGRIITATATDPYGNTSEFSQTAATEGPITQGPNGHYYQVVRARFGITDYITWNDAKIAAEQHTFGCLQGHLATITSHDEDVFVEALRVQFVAGAPEHVDPHLPGVEFWAGGYQLPNQPTPKAGWYWINNEGPIPGDNNGSSYANWLPNEPSGDSPSGADNNPENHLALGRLGFLGWNDEGNLVYVYGYVIEYEDNVPPQITPLADITVPCSTDLLVPVTFSVTATDNCNPAPVVKCSPASGSGFPIGTTTVTCTATDASGNSSTASFKVTRAALGFAGFLPPIGGADATGGSFANPLRTFKKGSTIPVKFTASCGTAPVLTGIHRLQAIKYSDATTAAAPIDATPQDAATTGNQFRLADSQWHFNLDTKGAGMTPGIWQLVATLSDGSQHHVWIALK
jgi:hypothetical protein